MARYFAFNTLAGADRANPQIVDGNATAGRFNSTYVSNCININQVDSYFEVVAPFMDGSSSASTIWVRFDLYQVYNLFVGGELLVFTDGGVPQYRIVAVSTGAVRMEYWTGAAWAAFSANFSPDNGVLRTLVVKLVCGTLMEVYRDGVLFASSNVTPTGASSSITSVRFGSLNNASSNANCFSQIMGADYDIRYAQYKPAAISGNSATNTDGTGTYTDINESVYSEATVITLPTSGNIKTFTTTAITMGGGFQIKSLVINAQGRLNGGVTDGKIAVRSGTTNYLSGDKSLTAAYLSKRHAWDTNPDTSSAWSLATFNAAEPGVSAS
jgi:hypothetical protein